MELVITLLVAGFLLLALETVLPGLIAGIVGFCCVVAGVVVAYQRKGPETGSMVLMSALAAGLVGAVLYLKYFPGSRAARRFTLTRTIGDIGTARPELVGQSGVAFTTLRPSGTALINNQRVDVVADGALIEKGTAIKVVAVEGLRVVVRQASGA
jgi:membrane-bound serine protease (ClpP class)